MKRVIILASAIFCLAACQSEEIENGGNQVVEPEQTSQAAEKVALWTPEHELQLTDYMEKMEAENPYYRYTPESNLDYAGVELPKDILKNSSSDWIPAVSTDNMTIEPIELVWYDPEKEDSQSAETYQVVSMYSNLTRENWPNFHIYLFTLKDGEPIVLHSAQTQGSPDNYFRFEKATDPEITEMFAEVMN